MRDWLAFTPADVDLARSPLRASLEAETFVLGAFNPGFTRLPNGNLLMMVRVAEALKQPVLDGFVHAVRWRDGTYATIPFPAADVDMDDPRHFRIKGPARQLALTSLSWLLPVEFSADASKIVRIHYDRAITPCASYQEYGVEDARISVIDGRYYMTACSVGAERHGTCLYISDNGLDYALQGIVLDHQNKDMLLFEGKVGGQFFALTRPLGEVYFAYGPDEPYLAGPTIQLASSPDALHWKPCDRPGIRARKGSPCTQRIGGGAQPVLTERGWLVLYHGVEPYGHAGIYRTFWALLDADDPSKILRLEDHVPILEADPALTAHLGAQMYLTDIVFTCGMVDEGDCYLVASGESDLACRLTRISKSAFA